MADPGLKEIFVKNQTTGELYQEGDFYTWPNLADTYEKISYRGGNEFYEGEVAQELVNDIQDAGGFMVLDDFTSYQ